jgi:hypothetical protein
MNLTFRSACAVFCAYIMCGCGLGPGQVTKQWSESMLQLGIVPVFPPREDVYVGDIYVYPFDPDGKLAQKAFDKGDSRIGTNPRWTSIDAAPPSGDVMIETGLDSSNPRILLTLLDTTYRQRPTWPCTPTQYAQMLSGNLESTSVFLEPIAGSSQVFKEDDPVNRLRIVGFPEFLSATFSKGDLSALIPAEAVKVAIAGAYNKAKSVTVHIPAAESYSLPSDKLYEFLVDKTQTQTPESSIILNEYFRKHLALFSTKGFEDLNPKKVKGDETQYLWLRVITEVYYAQVMDISITANEAGGFRANATTNGIQNPLNSGNQNNQNSGNQNSGNQNNQNSGNQNNQNSGNQNNQNSGNQNNQNSGNQNNQNSGNQNNQNYAVNTCGGSSGSSGSGRTSNPSTADDPVGDNQNNQNSGNQNSGNQNSGNQNNRNSGNQNSGNQNSGNQNNRNSGNQNSGNAQQNPSSEVDALNQQLTKAGSLTVPGGSIGFVAASDTAISMRRIWQHPIAIGFRGITLKVNRKSGEIVGAVSAGGPVYTNEDRIKAPPIAMNQQ